MHQMNRRALLGGIGASAIGAMTVDLAEARSRRQFFERMRQPIGLQFGEYA